MKQAEAACNVNLCVKKRHEKVEAQKGVDNACYGLSIKYQSALFSTVNTIMSRALRCRDAAPKTRSVLIEGTSAAVAMATEFLE